MPLLDQIIDASTDSSKPTTDLLRMVKIVARRVGATGIETWVRQEVDGYADGAALPDYRNGWVNVMGLFTGPMRARERQALTIRLPGLENLWRARCRQPLAELEALAHTEGDSQFGVPWPAEAVQMYEQSGLFRIEFFGLIEAHTVMTRQNFAGIVDVIRSRALDFALDLQEQFPDAGEKDGPTVATTPALAQTVGSLTVNITGHGANVGLGATVSQQSRVQIGDRGSLRRAATEAGLAAVDADEFVAAVEEERDAQGPRTSSVLHRVRSGAIAVSTSIGGGAAGDLLAAAVSQFLGLS